MVKLFRVIKIIMVNLSLLGLGIVILELLFGGWINPDKLNVLNIPKSVHREFNISHLYSAPYSEIIFTRDKYGLRGDFRSPSDIEILTVGGSTTDQRYLDDSKTWQAVLQRRFIENGKPIIIGNAGLDGQSTFGHIKNFQHWFPLIPNFKPRYILYYIGLNDFYKEQGCDWDALTLQDNKSLRYQIKNRSVLYHLFETGYYHYLAKYVYHLGHGARSTASARWSVEPFQKDYDKLTEVQIREFRERLIVLIDQTRQFGSIPIFVTQPTRAYRKVENGIEGLNLNTRYGGYNINGVDFYYMMKHLNEVIHTVSEEFQCYYFDMAEDMFQASTLNDDDFYDFVHMTPSGAEKVGDYLYQKLCKTYTYE